MSRRRVLLLGGAAILAALVFGVSQGRGPAGEGAGPMQLPVASFRLTLGVGDAAPRPWNGEVRPGPGQEVTVEADHLRVHKYAGAGPNSGPDPELPNDFIRDARRWVASTRLSVKRTPKGNVVVQSPSVLLHLGSGPASTPLEVETARGSFRFAPADVPALGSVAFLDGAVALERVPPVVAAAATQVGQQDFPALAETRSGDLWAAWQEYDGAADSVWARRARDGVWSQAFALESGKDVFGTAAGEDGRARTWVIWSMQVGGNWDLYGRWTDGQSWSRLERLTADPGPDLFHRTVRDARGRLWLVWTRPVAGRSTVFVRSCDGAAWSPEVELGAGQPGNCWFPAVAAGPNGIAVAWDTYGPSGYDVYLRRFEGERWGPIEAVAATPRFEAEPTLAIDAANRIWVAWIESGANWGKDTGRLVAPERRGARIYDSRSVRLVCLDGTRRLIPAGSLDAVLAPGEFWEAPRLEIDGAGNPWLFVKSRTTRQPDDPTASPSGAVYWAIWEIHATRYDGRAWSAPLRLPRSGGRNDGKPAAARDRAGALWLAWPTDLRNPSTYLPIQHRVELAKIAVPPASPPELVPEPERPAETFAPIHPAEAEQVARVRAYRVERGGKRYAIFRGDLHRHTEVSVDGGGDGSLLDAYRYARDAAALDFLGVTDHTHDVEEPYAWWRTQRTADLFQIPEKFAAFYAYERSVEYPNGHRNVLFVRRGYDVLPIESDELAGWEGAGRLFWYLRRNGGASIPHTSASGAGTDWRDRDAEVESLVEIFQGMRDTYEYPGAPSPKRLTPSPSDRSQNPGLRPLGFVWSALAKGYRLGFISSSDHLSTHISYAFLLAEKLTLESLREAIRARRAYAATDNIVLDVRSSGSDGEHLMGEDFASRTPARLRAKIAGTGPVSRVDVVRNGRIVYTSSPNRADVELEYADAGDASGEAYFYVRVMQADGEMAWGSPVWVRYEH